MTDQPVNGSPPGIPAPKDIPAGGRKATLKEAKSIFQQMVLAQFDQGGGNFSIPLEDLLELIINAELDSCRINALHEVLLGAKLVTPQGVRIITQEDVEAHTIGKITQRMIEIQTKLAARPRLEIPSGGLPPRRS